MIPSPSVQDNAITAWEALLLLVIIPDAPYGRTGAVLSALIVVFCVVGLTMHKAFYAGISRKDFFCFYTNLSNLLVGLYFALIAPRLFARAELHALIPHVEFSLMMSIMLTFSVFHLLLFPAVRSVICHAEHTREFKIVCTDNFIVHYLVPWLVFIYWLLCSPGKTALTFRNAILWTLLPVTYLLCIFIHARCGRLIQETQSLYPYPFLDLNALGAKTVLRTCLLLYSICVIAGSLVILITRLMFALFGSGHPLILI